MANTQVTSLHPVRVDGDLRAPVTVRNESGVTVYYRAQEAVSSGTNDGSLTEHQEVTLVSATWFITKAPSTTEPKNLIEEAEIRVFPATSPTHKLIHQLNAVYKESLAVGVYFAVAAVYEKATALAISSAETTTIDTFWYDPAIYAMVGKAASLTLDISMLCDNVEPENKFKFGLYKVEKSEAAEKKVTLTFEAVVSQSVVEISKPAAKSITHASGSFAPPAAGVYSIGVETITATSAAKSFEAIAAMLYSA